MRYVLLAGVLALAVVMTLGGCDGGETANIDGDWSAGTVTFDYGGGVTWTLRQVIVSVDTTTTTVSFSGFDGDGLLWEYRGDYSRTDNRIVAQDLPEIDFGSEDQLDLRLEFTGRNFNGAAINWVYDGSELSDVGATNIRGTRGVRSAELEASTSADRSEKVKYDRQ